MCRKNVWRRDTEKWRLMPVLQLVRQIRFMWGHINRDIRNHQW